MFVVDNEIDATFGDLRLHRFVALLVNIELPLRADDMAQGEDGDRLRGSLKLHVAALEDENSFIFAVSSFGFFPSLALRPLARVQTPLFRFFRLPPPAVARRLRPSVGLSAAYTPVRSFSLFWYAFTSGSG